MKKLLVFVIVAVTAVWLFAAHKFEQYVQDTLPNDLERIAKIVKVDPALLKVNKYTFSLRTGEAKFFEGSTFYQINAEGLRVCYNPFTQNITLKVTGNKEFIKLGKAEFYIENPSDTITFKRSLLKEGLNNLRITLSTDKESKLRSVTDDSELLEFKKARMLVTGKDSEIEGNYKLAVELEVDKERIYNGSRLLNMVMGTSLPASKDELELINKIYDTVGDLNKKVSFSLDIKKSFLEKLTIALAEENMTSSLAEEILASVNPYEDKYFVGAEYFTNDSASDSRIKLALGNDGTKISVNYSFGSNINYTETQKNALASIFGGLFYEIIKNDPRYQNLNRENIGEKTFEGVAKRLLDINRGNLHFNLDYEKESKNFDGSLVLALNAHEIQLEGKGIERENTIDTEIKVTDPNAIIINGARFVEEALYPLLDKLVVSPDDKGLHEFKHLVTNIKTNGFDALAALNKEPDLKPGENFAASVHANLQKFEFKINDKGFLEILTDKRIEKFLEEMSQTHRQQDNN